MDYMIDNPMTFGDYPGAEDAEITAVCPRCGRVWEGWTTMFHPDELLWDCEDFEYSSDDDPIQNDSCPACVWERHSDQDEMEYIETRGLEQEVIVWCLFDRAVSSCDIKSNRAREWWNMIREHEPDYLKEIIHDYIEEEEKSEFIEWLMGK